MPNFSVIYVKRTEKTPKTTTITFTFPDGQSVDYKSANVILEEFTKEYIVEKRLFPYIPFYIARYEKEIASEESIEAAVKDLGYFRDEIMRLHKEEELLDDEMVDLMGFVNTIITHITNGNQNEERRKRFGEPLHCADRNEVEKVNIMGGTVIETESEKLVRQGKIQMIIEMAQEYGLDDAAILKKLQEKVGMSPEQAATYLEKYGKQFA